MFATLLLLWLAADIGHILADAAPRVQAEARSVSRLTLEFVVTSLAGLQDAQDPEQAVVALVSSLQFLRHVRVVLGENALASAIVAPSDSRADAPRWFQALVHAPFGVTTIPVLVKGRRLDSIAIVADPSDEIDEVWSQARTEVAAGAALALAVLIATSVFVRLSLRPLGVAGTALAHLEAGDFSARAKASGSPEFVDICGRINHLAEALSNLSAANRDLLERVFDAHDEERKVIAHELHDEIGPHLFALRASASILVNRLRAGAEAAAAADAIRDQVEALQQQNRRILASLRPAALEELGLGAALQALAEHWRRAEPRVALVLTVAPKIGQLCPRSALTVYRFVQEALTNAFHHSDARRIEASLFYEPSVSGAGLGDPALEGLRIRVSDNGRGPVAETGAGMGLLGLRERVKALGGEFVFRASPGEGAVVEASFGLRA